MRAAIRRGDERIDNQVWGLLPEDFTGWDCDRAGCRRRADRRRRRRPRAATTSSARRAFLEAEGVTHTLRFELRRADRARAVIVRDIPGSRAPRRDLAVRLSGRRRSRARGPAPAAGDGRLVGDRPRQRLRARAPRGRAVARGRAPSARGVLRPRPGRARAGARRGSPSRSGQRARRLGGGVDSGARSAAADRDAFAARLRADDARRRRRASATSSTATTSTPCSRSSAAGCWSLARAASRGGGDRRPSATASCTTSSAARPTPRATPRRSRTWSRRCSTSPTSSPCRSTSAAGSSRATGSSAFKRGFANAELAFSTHEVVCDPDAYAELSAGRRRATGFFPAYRRERLLRHRPRRRLRAAVERGEAPGRSRSIRACTSRRIFGILAVERPARARGQPDRAVAEDLVEAHPAAGGIAAQLAAGRGQRCLAAWPSAVPPPASRRGS